MTQAKSQRVVALRRCFHNNALRQEGEVFMFYGQDIPSYCQKVEDQKPEPVEPKKGKGKGKGKGKSKSDASEGVFTAEDLAALEPGEHVELEDDPE